MVQYSLDLLLKNKNYKFLDIFKVGFIRNEKILKRQLPNYLLIVCDEKMKNILLFYKEIRNLSLYYNNKTFIINLKRN